VNADQRLSHLVRALGEGGVDALIMGGHAVRYYGIDRNTIDFDLVAAVSTTDELRSKLAIIPVLTGAREQRVWRPRDFARFEIGRLPDGRPEWLEFWIRNHLLDDFNALKSRREVGTYGGGQLAFLSLADLIKSKETERESDWRDIEALEEVLDERNFGALDDSPESRVHLLRNLRSRRGMRRAMTSRLLDNREVVRRALADSTHPGTAAFLLPKVPAPRQADPRISIEPTVRSSLESAVFGSPIHFALIEICRRAYKRSAMDLDRADKQARLKEFQ
jgi:hypothetical protein